MCAAPLWFYKTSKPGRQARRCRFQDTLSPDPLARIFAPGMRLTPAFMPSNPSCPWLYKHDNPGQGDWRVNADYAKNVPFMTENHKLPFMNMLRLFRAVPLSGKVLLKVTRTATACPHSGTETWAWFIAA